jgi:hypothetical protein
MPPVGDVDSIVFQVQSNELMMHFQAMLQHNEARKRQKMAREEEGEQDAAAPSSYPVNDLRNPDFDVCWDAVFNTRVFWTILKDCNDEIEADAARKKHTVSGDVSSSSPIVTLADHVPVMPMAWQAGQMRTANVGEERCINDDKCTVARHPKHKWTMKSCVFMKEKNQRNVPRRECVACMRISYEKTYYGMVSCGIHKSRERMLNAPFIHLSGIEDEYNPNQIIGPCDTSLPVAKLDLDKCKTEDVNGVRYLREDKSVKHNQQLF